MHDLFAIMSTIDYRARAEEWMNHIAGQHGKRAFCVNDLPLVEHLLKAGFTLIAVRGRANRLRIDFLGKRSLTPKKLVPA